MSSPTPFSRPRFSPAPLIQALPPRNAHPGTPPIRYGATWAPRTQARATQAWILILALPVFGSVTLANGWMSLNPCFLG